VAGEKKKARKKRERVRNILQTALKSKGGGRLKKKGGGSFRVEGGGIEKKRKKRKKKRAPHSPSRGSEKKREGEKPHKEGTASAFSCPTNAHLEIRKRKKGRKREAPKPRSNFQLPEKPGKGREKGERGKGSISFII